MSNIITEDDEGFRGGFGNGGIAIKASFVIVGKGEQRLNGARVAQLLGGENGTAAYFNVYGLKRINDTLKMILSEHGQGKSGPDNKLWIIAFEQRLEIGNSGFIANGTERVGGCATHANIFILKRVN
jgi:hypothetical protein